MPVQLGPLFYLGTIRSVLCGKKSVGEKRNCLTSDFRFQISESFAL